MATDLVILRDASKKAGADLSEKQFFLVKVTEENTVVLAASGDIAYSLDSTPKENEFATYAIAGIVKVKCGGTIKQGALVAANNSGTAQEAASGQRVVGQALEEGKTGQIIKIIAPASAAKA